MLMNFEATMNVVLISPLKTRTSGNKTTGNRIKKYLEDAGIICTALNPLDPQDVSLHSSCLPQFKAAIAIHALHSSPVLVQACKISLPYVLIFGGTDLNESTNTPSLLEQMTSAVEGAQFVVAFGPSMTKKALEKWPTLRNGKLIQIPQGVTVFPSDFSLKLHIREVFDIHDVDHIFLLPAGVRPVKDVLYTIPAFSDLHNSEFKTAWLVIIGPALDEDYYQEVKAAVRSHAGVLLLDEIPEADIQASMKESTAVINSSISEGMASVILEAMALGVPVIARDIPGNRDLIDHDVTGLLFSSPEEFKSATKLLISNCALKEVLTRNAKEKVDQFHQPQEEAKAYLDLISKLRSF